MWETAEVASGRGLEVSYRSSTSENLLLIACKRQGMAMAAETITVGTWNVQTLWQTGKLQMLEKELERIRYDVIGLSEVRWTGTEEALHGRLIYTGELNKHEKGVGIVVSERVKRALISYNPISPRVIVARFRGRPFD